MQGLQQGIVCRRFSQMPMLRPRQKQLVDKAIVALKSQGNTLAVAPTGSGKTFMFSAVIRDRAPQKTLVVAHRDELTTQNQQTFLVVNPDVTTSLFNASGKSFDARVVFAMIQSVSQQKHLASLPKFDLVVFDEAHHVYAPTYQALVNRVKEVNPKVEILGMTATPNRADKKPIRSVFSNVCDQITIQEVIKSGHLVEPKFFVVDTGFQRELELAGLFADEKIADILNTSPTNEAVIKHWKEKAADRQTVVFCSTLEHAQSVHSAFVNSGVEAGIIHSLLGDKERKAVLEAYGAQKFRVIVNVSVLAEGWDDPPTSCVVLLRACSSKSAMIQMIGRGLRPPNHPQLIKNDCLVLDFGLSVLTHGSSLSQTVQLFPEKKCSNCQGMIDTAASECPLCGHVPRGFTGPRMRHQVAGSIDNFTMKELDQSNFPWLEVAPGLLMVSGFEAFCCVVHHDGKWFAIGAYGERAKKLELLVQGGVQTLCVAASNDFMNLHETNKTAQATKMWHTRPVSDKQLQLLGKSFVGNRYLASALLNLKFNSSTIESILFTASKKAFSVRRVVSAYLK